MLLPSESVVRYMNRKSTDWIKYYNNFLATLIGLGVMLFTNVLLDVPLTNAISKKIMPFFGIKPNQQKQEGGKNKPAEREQKPVEEKILDSFENRNKWRAGV